MNRWMLRAASLFVAGGALTSVAVVACSSSSSSGAPAQCNTNPFACASGQTCWPKSCNCPSGQKCSVDNCIPQFDCLPSAAGKNPHDSCNNTINVTTCGDNQACIELTAAGGNCLVYCDPASPKCVSDELCVAYAVGKTQDAPKVNVCTPRADIDGGNPFGLGDSGGGGPITPDGAPVPAPDAAGFDSGMAM